MQQSLNISTPQTELRIQEELQGRFSRAVKPGCLLFTGGSGTGKTSTLDDLRSIARITGEKIDALTLADQAWNEHGTDGSGLGRMHIHPQDVYDSHTIEAVYNEKGEEIGHRHGRIIHPTVAHFPFEVSDSLLTPEEMELGNPLILHTYTAFFQDMVNETLDTDGYCYVELAGGKNILSHYQPEHHMASLDVSYEHLTKVLKYATREDIEQLTQLRSNISVIVDIHAPRAVRIARTLGRDTVGEERTPVLIDVQGINDTKETLANFLQVPYIRIDNNENLSAEKRRQGFYAQMDEQLKKLA